ncbi:hypothetical protein HG1285_04723, partial [Hydrogenivirga sp. 128-5-R1-1]
MQMNNDVKIYEGEDLQKLIYKAKEELGEDIKILHYEEIFEKIKWFPFKKKKKYKLFVEKREIQTKQEIDFNKLLEKVEIMVEEKIKNSITELKENEVETNVDISVNEF